MTNTRNTGPVVKRNWRANFAGRRVDLPDPAEPIAQQHTFMTQQRFFALKREVDDLVAFQIQALTQGFALNSTQLHDCHVRFERIMDLQEEVARLRKERILEVRKRPLAG